MLVYLKTISVRYKIPQEYIKLNPAKSKVKDGNFNWFDEVKNEWSNKGNPVD